MKIEWDSNSIKFCTSDVFKMNSKFEQPNTHILTQTRSEFIYLKCIFSFWNAIKNFYQHICTNKKRYIQNGSRVVKFFHSIKSNQIIKEKTLYQRSHCTRSRPLTYWCISVKFFQMKIINHRYCMCLRNTIPYWYVILIESIILYRYMSKSKIHLRMNWKHNLSVYVTIDLIVKVVTCDNLMITHPKFIHFVLWF